MAVNVLIVGNYPCVVCRWVLSQPTRV